MSDEVRWGVVKPVLRNHCESVRELVREMEIGVRSGIVCGWFKDGGKHKNSGVSLVGRTLLGGFLVDSGFFNVGLELGDFFNHPWKAVERKAFGEVEGNARLNVRVELGSIRHAFNV